MFNFGVSNTSAWPKNTSLQRINNTDDEKQKYTHHKAPIYTEMYTHKLDLFNDILKRMQLIVQEIAEDMFQNEII